MKLPSVLNNLVENRSAGVTSELLGFLGIEKASVLGLSGL
jgi:hypothetical protein